MRTEALFIVFHGFDANNGISKKITYHFKNLQNFDEWYMQYVRVRKQKLTINCTIFVPKKNV